MIDVISVNLWGKQVGALAFQREVGVFEFSPSFLKSGLDIAPKTMPLAELPRKRLWSFPSLNRETYYGLPGMIADSLPDRFGNALIDRFMAEKGIRKDQVTPLDRLSYMGKRGMGALEFVPAQRLGRESQAPLEMAHLVEAARLTLKGSLVDEKESNETLRSMIRVGTSAGGARAKAVIALNPATHEVRSGQFDAAPGFEQWILKFDGVGVDEELGNSQAYGRIEYAYFLMARAAGIQMADCDLLKENGRAHFMTKRFDRVDGQKLHMQSLCALEHLDFNLSGTHSYQQYIRLILDLGLGYQVAQEGYRRMAFNVMARNCDDHTKNFAFLMDSRGRWSLAPAYDVTFAYNPEGRWTSRHQMSVNGVFTGHNKGDLLSEARRLGIPQTERILDQIASAIGDWPRWAAAAEVPPEIAASIGKNHVLLN